MERDPSKNKKLAQKPTSLLALHSHHQQKTILQLICHKSSLTFDFYDFPLPFAVDRKIKVSSFVFNALWFHFHLLLKHNIIVLQITCMVFMEKENNEVVFYFMFFFLLFFIIQEPTSSLDSCTAAHLMQMLKNYAYKEAKSVVVAVHQPSSKIFHLFDRLLLLQDGQVSDMSTTTIYDNDNMSTKKIMIRMKRICK